MYSVFCITMDKNKQIFFNKIKENEPKDKRNLLLYKNYFVLFFNLNYVIYNLYFQF